MNGTAEQTCPERFQISWLCPIVKWRAEKQRDATTAPLSRRSSTCGKDQPRHPSFVNSVWQTMLILTRLEFACQESSIGKGNPLWPFDSFCIFGCIGDPPGLLRVEEAPAELADEALKMALVRRNDPKGCVHHSDSKNVASRFCGNRKGAVSCSWNHVAAS